MTPKARRRMPKAKKAACYHAAFFIVVWRHASGIKRLDVLHLIDFVLTGTTGSIDLHHIAFFTANQTAGNR